jgi:arylsulfate sulfotransferase
MRERLLGFCASAVLIVSQLGCALFPSAKTNVPAYVQSGYVSATDNPQVAQYKIGSQGASSTFVEFGPDTNYGLVTDEKEAPFVGSTVSIFVAGMRASTTYHMRAVLRYQDGTVLTDSDHTFTTGALPTTLPQISVSRPSSLTPQPGVELIDTVVAQPQAFVTDLDGNVIWSYTYPTSTRDIVQPIKLLPNGDFLLVISPNSDAPVNSNDLVVMREINLAGEPIREISRDTLNARLAAAGYDLSVQTMHHDVLPLPNGHIILLVNLTRNFTDLPGYTGTTTVLGDALVDLDPDMQPVWVWNSFDYLDVNRHPMNFPDWTHANAALYSPDDGDLLLSVRHQNWLLKIDYRDGQGTGAIVWRLGQGGDFTLENGSDPTDWFYAQHGPAFTTSNTAGVFPLVLFDNGDDRMFPAGVTCGSTGAPACLYSTISLLGIDEKAKTASLNFHYVAPQYSFFGGNAEMLANGDLEFDEASAPVTFPTSSAVLEITPTDNPQVVWQMNLVGTYAYRAMRTPSLYPGVQW